MYHAIVKRIATKNFERVNQRNFDSLLNGCIPILSWTPPGRRTT